MYHRRLCALVVNVFLAAMLGACSEQASTSPSQRVIPHPTTGFDEQKLPEDAAWDSLLAGHMSSTRAEEESYFEFFYRKKELDLQHFRRAGLRFWESYPDDPRRYDWLLVTVGAPPAYPIDLEEWVRQSTQLGPNNAPIDESAVQKWAEQYALLRQEFWASDQVSDVQRRALWSTEIRAHLLDLIPARARGEDVSLRRRQLIDELAEFASNYSEPFPNDSPFYTELHWLFQSIFDLAFGRHDTLGLSRQELRAVLQEVSEVEGAMAAFYTGPGKLASDGVYRMDTLGMLPVQFAEDMKSLADASWSGQLLDDVNALALIVYESVLFPAQNQPILDAEYALFKVQHAEGAIRFLEHGLAYWDQLTDQEKVEWAGIASNFQPAFPKGYTAGFSSLSRYDAHPVDLRAMYQYEQRVFEALRELGKHSDLDPEQNDRILSAMLFILAGQSGYVAAFSPGDLPARRNEIYEMVETALRGASTPSALISRLEYIWRIRADIGLSEIQLQTILAPYENSPDESFRKFVASVLNPIELQVGTPVAISAPRLEGELFDTSDLKGKIILIDHWDTNCAPCIAAFPGIHETYLEYQDRGFEVVSIAYDGSSRRSTVDRIKDQFGLTWTTLNGEGLWGGVAARYGYPGYPQYMLLDREGRYVAGTAEMGNGANLEALLKEMLSAEAAEKDVATVR